MRSGGSNPSPSATIHSHNYSGRIEIVLSGHYAGCRPPPTFSRLHPKRGRRRPRKGDFSARIVPTANLGRCRSGRSGPPAKRLRGPKTSSEGSNPSLPASAPVAQGIERSAADAEATGSSPVGGARIRDGPPFGWLVFYGVAPTTSVSVSRWGRYGSGVETLAVSCPQDPPEGPTPARILGRLL